MGTAEAMEAAPVMDTKNAKDKTVSILGAMTKIERVSLYPQEDGTTQLEVVGSTKDSEDATVALALPPLTIKTDDLIAKLLNIALSELRKANGLE